MIYLLAFLMNITTGMLILCGPLLALERFSADSLMLGLLGFGPAIVYALGCAASGFWVDRFGSRKIITAACLFLPVVFLSIFFVSRYRHLLLLALAAGAGASLFWPAMIRWLGEDDRDDTLRLRVGNYNIALIGGVMVGPLATGFLFPIDYRFPFLLAALLAAAILLIFRWGRKPAPAGAGVDVPDNGGEDLPAAPRAGFDYIAWAANFGVWFAIGGSQALFPELALKLPDPIGERALGVMIALIPAGQVAVFILLRRWHRWHYNYSFLFLFQLLALAGLFILAGNNRHPLFFAGFLAIGFAGGMTYFSSIYYSVHRQEKKGKKGGFHESFLGLGVALGPLLGGLAGRGLGLRAPYLLAAFVLAGSILVQFFILGRFTRKTREGTAGR
ncbi:MAG: MFS transporter [Candidatus Erginobacter occultus]|nr:MFS transporter [Candidatus Erginobacter occultus]